MEKQAVEKPVPPPTQMIKEGVNPNVYRPAANGTKK